MYADDVIFLGKWCSDSLSNLKRLLRCFHLSSGLGINLDKSFLYGIGVDDDITELVALELSCKIGAFPFNHLGLCIGGNMNIMRNWKPVVEVFKKRLSLWKAKTLSFGGRITLIKSVLNSLPTYYFSLFKAPVGVLKSLERIRREFLWGSDDVSKKVNWVSWSKTILSKNNGGIGLGSLRETNLALLSKWWWRFKSEPERLWRKVIWCLHHSSRSWNFIPRKLSIPGPWKQICSISGHLQELGLDIHTLYHVIPGTNSELLFWYDNWLLDTPLRLQFPNLFLLEANRLCSLKDRIQLANGSQLLNFHWVRELNQSEHSEVNMLIELTYPINWAGEKDVWRNDMCTMGKYDIKLIKSKIREVQEEPLGNKFTWIKWVPIKANFLLWRVWLDRLPTKDNLAKRNININSTECGVCNLEDESLEHLFGSCEVSIRIWDFISSWCRIPNFYFFSACDLPTLAPQLNGDVEWKLGVHLIIAASVWCIWKNRNNVAFNSELKSVNSIIDEIRHLSYSWIKNRSRYKTLTIEKWCDFNFR